MKKSGLLRRRTQSPEVIAVGIGHYIKLTSPSPNPLPNIIGMLACVGVGEVNQFEKPAKTS
jgi:hypothetical protein